LLAEEDSRWQHVTVRARRYYGSAAGVRGVQQLRLTAIELQLAPIRSSVHIPAATLWTYFNGGDVEGELEELSGSAGALIDDLIWWTRAVQDPRARNS